MFFVGYWQFENGKVVWAFEIYDFQMTKFGCYAQTITYFVTV